MVETKLDTLCHFTTLTKIENKLAHYMVYMVNV